MSKTIDQQVADFWNGWAGKELKQKLENGTYNMLGTWHIEGEDPNADLGGHHHNPHIAFVYGNIHEIIPIAVQVRRFYSWGSGGRFTQINTLDVPEFRDLVNGEEEMARLEKQLKELKAKRR